MLFRSLTLYGPDKACIGGLIAPWCKPKSEKEDNKLSSFWDEKSDRFTLGDFECLAKFLGTFLDFQEEHKL